MIVTVAVGAAIALLAAGSLWWLRHRQAPMPATQAGAAVAKTSANKPHPRVTPKGSERFQFYRILPKVEVPVPERAAGAGTGSEPPAVEVPGAYVLQAGSYATVDEAERVRTKLAQLGIHAEIQPVSMDDRELHRVRIGPVEDLAELNRLRRRLHDAKIEASLIRIGD